MLTSDDIEQFVLNMKKVASYNPKLKKLNPGGFEQQVKQSADEILQNPEALEELKTSLKKDEISPEEVELIMFVKARNVFLLEVIYFLEEIYEASREIILSGIGEKGIDFVKKTDVGAEYAKLVETNIQLLDNAIKSLHDLAKQGES